MLSSANTPNNDGNRPDQQVVDSLLASIETLDQLNGTYKDGRLNFNDVTAFFNDPNKLNLIWGDKFIPALEMLTDHQDVLINLLLTNLDLYNSVMNTANLIKLAKRFPQHASALITYPFKCDQFTPCIKIRTCEELIQALQELPDYKTELLETTLYLHSSNDRLVIDTATKLKDVAVACRPDHTDILLGCLLNHEKEYTALMIRNFHFKKGEVFPDHKDIVLQPTYEKALAAFQNKKKNTATPEPVKPVPKKKIDIKNIYSVTMLCEYYNSGDLDLDQVTRVVKEPELYNQIIETYLDYFIQFAQAFPQLAVELINFPGKHPDKCKPVITGYGSLIKAANALPDHKALLIAPFLKDPNSYSEIIKLYGKYDASCLIELVQLFPEQAEELISFPDKHPQAARVIADLKTLIDAAEKLKEYKAALIKPFLNNVALYNKIIRSNDYGNDRSNFDELAKTFPDQLEELLNFPDKYPEKECKLLLTGADEMSYYALGKSPQHQTLLFNTYLNTEEKLKSQLKSFYSLRSLAMSFPDHKNTFIDFVLKDLDVYHLIISQYNHLKETAELYPEHKNALILILFNHPDAFRKIFSSSWRMREAAELFPDCKEAFSHNDCELALKAFHGNQAPTATITKPEIPQTTPSAYISLNMFNADDEIKDELAKRDEVKRLTFFNAIKAATDEYLEWYKTGNSYRGPSGWNAWCNHRDNGKQAAEKLALEIIGADHIQLHGLIRCVLSASPFKNHSLGSFLMDQLLNTNIKNSLWDEKKYPGYKRKYPTERMVITKIANNTNS